MLLEISITTGFFLALGYSLVSAFLEGLDTIERIAVSLGFGIAVMPPLLYYLSLLGVGVSLSSLILSAFSLVVTCAIYKLTRRGKVA